MLGFWKENKLHGPIVTYYDNGVKVIQGFKDGVKHGECLTFDPAGNSHYESFTDGVQSNYKPGGAKQQKSNTII
mgnify:FL=1|jgi:antitoxin component YwqK of YwqJK toxin-antitoxin module